MSFSKSVATIGSIFMTGIIDSISYHLCIPLLYKDVKVRNIVIQVLLSNLVLLLGSVGIYNFCIIEGLAYVQKNYMPYETSWETILASNLTWIIFHAFWLVPIYILCYVTSSSAYQQLADHLHCKKKKIITDGDKSLKKTVAYATYGSVAWLMVFTQNQLLGSLIPLGLSQVDIYIKYICASSYPQVLPFISLLIQSMIVSSEYAAIFLSAALYGWYSFDPQWISSDVDPIERFAIIEKHWIYFIAYGTPFVLINKTFPFFVGYGIYLALFPFAIIGSEKNGYIKAYNKVDSLTAPPKLEIFKYGRIWAEKMLQGINKKNE